MKDDIKWVNPGHKQRRYTLEMSDDLRLFKKSTTRLHKTLEIELSVRLSEVVTPSSTKMLRCTCTDTGEHSHAQEWVSSRSAPSRLCNTELLHSRRHSQI